MLEALNSHTTEAIIGDQQKEPTPERLRQQMKEDALQPLEKNDDDNDAGDTKRHSTKLSVPQEDQFTPDILEEAVQFLRLQVRPHSIRVSLPGFLFSMGC